MLAKRLIQGWARVQGQGCKHLFGEGGPAERRVRGDPYTRSEISKPTASDVPRAVLVEEDDRSTGSGFSVPLSGKGIGLGCGGFEIEAVHAPHGGPTSMEREGGRSPPGAKPHSNRFGNLSSVSAQSS
jgi:hypothetical protein